MEAIYIHKKCSIDDSVANLPHPGSSCIVVCNNYYNCIYMYLNNKKFRNYNIKMIKIKLKYMWIYVKLKKSHTQKIRGHISDWQKMHYFHCEPKIIKMGTCYCQRPAAIRRAIAETTPWISDQALVRTPQCQDSLANHTWHRNGKMASNPDCHH